MKKTIVIVYCLLLSMVSIVGIVAQKAKTHPTQEYSSLTLANINALTGNEETPGEEGGNGGGNGGPITNVETGGSNYEFPDGQHYEYRCFAYLGKNFFGISQYCKVTVVICQGGGKGCNSKKCKAHSI